MNLKLRRLVRTPYSEQYALFDLDAASQDGSPASIGKLDLHFTDDGVIGTVLLWKSFAATVSVAQRRAFIDALLSDISQPAGLPGQFAVELFSPDLDTYSFFHNLEVAENNGEQSEEKEDRRSPD
jgi:hypothetical protein